MSAISARNRTVVERPLASGLCLGGIGCGGIELWADGVFRHFAFMNTAPWAGYRPVDGVGAPREPRTGPEDLFFILRVQRPHRPPQLRFLFAGNGTAFNTWDHMSRTYKYATCPSMPAIEHHAEFPFVRLRFRDDGLPVEVELEAWTPFVPLDHVASSTPGVVFDVRVRNRGDEPLAVSLFQVTSNLAGFDQANPGHAHVRRDVAGGTLIAMSGGVGAEPTTGGMAAFARAGAGQRVTAIAANPHIENLYYAIHRGGALDAPLHPDYLKHEEMRAQPHDDPMRRNRAWLCVQQELAPGATALVRTGLTWHFPNHVDQHGQRIGKFYENRFADAAAVATHLLAEGDALRQRSRALPDLVLGSGLEPRFALSLLDQAATLAKATWFAKDGSLFVWEGLGHAGLDTVDVDHYGSFGLAALFPALRATVLDLIGAGQKPNGRIPHSYSRNLRAQDIPEGEYHRFDVNCQYVLALYRDWSWTGDAALLERHWPRAKRALDFVRALDRLGVGLPFTEGGITYDHWHMVGIVAYMADLHLVALQAAAAMARARGEGAYADACVAEWERGRASFERLLWVGDRYRAVLPGQAGAAPAAELDEHGKAFQAAYHTGDANAAVLSRKPIERGLHTDALNGEATAALLGLPRALEPARVRAMLRLILARNRNPDARFLANGRCDDGAFPDEWPFSQWDNPWTGTEYWMAAQCFAEGEHAAGLELIGDVFDRLEAAGVRFVHNECGDHYSRALSIYAAHQAWLGFVLDAPAQALRLAPHADQHQGPFFAGTAWGRIAWSRPDGGFRLELMPVGGALTLARLELPGTGAATASLDGRALGAERRAGAIILAGAVRVAPGQRLVVNIA